MKQIKEINYRRVKSVMPAQCGAPLRHNETPGQEERSEEEEEESTSDDVPHLTSSAAVYHVNLLQAAAPERAHALE